MKRNLVAAALIALMPLAANASDARICYSSILNLTQGAPSGTVTYPQIGNTTSFACGLDKSYNLPQLSQMGWIVVSIAPVEYQMIYNTDGTITSRSRYMLLIQK